MQKTTLEQWRMFQAVVENGGFNQAAQAIHKSQSTIHHNVHKLEETLGIKLLEVQGRKAVLTPDGKLLLERGNHVLGEVKKLENAAAILRSGVEIELRIAVDGAFPQTVLFDVLNKVSIKYPTLKIDIIETILSGANELLELGHANIGLSPIPMEKGLNEELCHIEFVAVASPEHYLHTLNYSIDDAKLKNCRQIVVRDSAINTEVDAGWLSAEQKWTVGNMQTSIHLVCQNMGFAWLPLPAIRHLLKSNRLKPLPLVKGQKRTVGFFLNYDDENIPGPAARELISELRFTTLNMSMPDFG